MNNRNNTDEKIGKKKTYKYKITAFMLAAILAMSGCSAASAKTTAGSASADTSVSLETSSGTSAASKSEMFTERDLSGEYDEAEAVSIVLSGSSAEVSANSSSAGQAAAGVSVDGSTVTITEEGTYIVTGTLSDGQIIVDADDTAKVQIVLNGASVTSKSSAALYVRSADKVFVTTAAGTQNTLANGGTFTAIDDNNIDAAVFAKDDITFNGSGTVTIESPAGHGIAGKDDVKLAGGTIVINAASHGVQANDSVRIAEADITINAGSKDGIHVSDSSDEETGETSDSYFYMADGSLAVTAGDDGIHADAEALIEGGSITITKSYEGIEALTIDISGGTIDVTATDDGLNAAGGSNTGSQTFGEDDWFGGPGGGFDDGGTDGSIVISGGSLHITAGGDAVDSNGSVEITGGYTVTEGPSQGDTSVLDYNSTGTITGGTFIGTGGAGMAENFSSVSNQGLIAVSVGSQSAGTAVTLKNQSGETIAEVTPDLDYAVVYISTPDIAAGGTYTLTAGTYSETIELTDTVYSTIAGGMKGGTFGEGGPMDMNNGMPGDGQTGMDGGIAGDGQSNMNGGFNGNAPGRGQDMGNGMRGHAPGVRG